MPQRPASRAHAHPTSRPFSPGVVARVGTAVLLAAGFCVAATTGRAQVKDPAPAASAAAKVAVSKPLWRDLGSRQQRALQPLAPYWDSLTEPHKRKWLALSRNFAKMSPAEQEVLYSRMSEWAGLSNQQRTQARFNFAEVKQVPVDERKAKWEAYQALSEEEKRKLAERATPRPGAAATINPVPAQKLAPLPTVAPDRQHAPRIQLAPPVAPARPQLVAPAAIPVFPPVSAEAQVPAPSPSQGDAATAAVPPVRVTEQPSSAP